MNGFYDQIAEILKKNGYSFLRSGKGSHEIWTKNGRDAVTVPRATKSRHTANEILKQAGLPKQF